MDFLKNPTILIVGAVALVAGYVLLQNKGKSSTGAVTNPGQSVATDPTMASSSNYTWLDGSGVEHVIATSPNGDMNTYASDSAAYDPYLYAGQLSSYNWASGIYTNPYGGHTPPYSQVPVQQFAEQ